MTADLYSIYRKVIVTKITATDKFIEIFEETEKKRNVFDTLQLHGDNSTTLFLCLIECTLHFSPMSEKQGDKVQNCPTNHKRSSPHGIDRSQKILKKGKFMLVHSCQ